MWDRPSSIHRLFDPNTEYDIPAPDTQHRTWACYWLRRLVLAPRNGCESEQGYILSMELLRGATLDGGPFAWGSKREYIESEFVETEDGLRPRGAADGS